MRSKQILTLRAWALKSRHLTLSQRARILAAVDV